MSTFNRPNFPVASHPVLVVRNGSQHLDLYVDPAVTGTGRDALQIHVQARSFGIVHDEEGYVRLRVNPVFKVEAVEEYLQSLWPPYEVVEDDDELDDETEDELAETEPEASSDAL